MTHFAHFTHGYGGNTPRSSRTLVKVVNGDTLTFTIHIRRPYSSEPVSSGDARKPDVSVVLSENRFYNLIWTGTLADGDIALDENVPGVAYVTVPRDVMSALRRGIYAFSVTVDDGERRETQTRGHIQVEYEPTSATHDIPYREDAWKGDVGLSFRPPRVLTEYESVDAFPATGVKGVLYLAADTNTLYRWDGSGYSRLGGSGGSGLTEEQAALIAQVPGKLDKSDVVELSEDAVTGQAADAKATFDAIVAKANKATTLAGYGITDAATKTELDEVGQRAANAILGVQSELSTKADLVDGKVPANQLPSYVDDVLEYDSVSAFPSTGEDGKIYVANDTNKTYRWGGTQYVEISQSLALGETAETAYPGDKGKAAAEKADAAYSAAESLAHGVNSLAGTIGTHIRDTNNPHEVTAAQVGALPLEGGTLTGDLAIGEAFAGSRTLSIASDNGAAGITLKGGTSHGNGSILTIGGSSDGGATLNVNGGGMRGGRVIVGASTGGGGTIEVKGNGSSIKKNGKEVATEEQVETAKTELNSRIDKIERSSNPNMNVIGNPIFKEGSVSGFSANDYMVFPAQVSVGQSSVELYLSFSTGIVGTDQQNLLDSNKGLAFAIRNGKFITAISINGTDWFGEDEGDTVRAESAYEIKMTFTYEGGQYIVRTFVKENNEWKQMGSGISANAPAYSTTTYLGGVNPQATNHIFLGSINLNECRMVFDGNEVWSGYDVLARNIVTYDQTKPVGEQLSTAEKIVDVLKPLAQYPIKAVVGNALLDRTVNTSTGGAFTFPEGGDGARDFVVVVAANSTAPSVSFPSTGFTYFSDDDSVWTAEADKVNIWYFTEITANQFMVAHKALSQTTQA